MCTLKDYNIFFIKAAFETYFLSKILQWEIHTFHKMDTQYLFNAWMKLNIDFPKVMHDKI